MAIPLIIAGAAGLLGLKGHLSAKETNEMAQRVSQEAQNMYNDAKVSLEAEHKVTEQALLKLGNSKKRIMDGSINRFLTAYDRIKDVQLSDSTGLNELSNFSIDKQDTIELRKMSDIYSSSISSGATGAAAGAIIALAASGSLPIVTGTLSIAGSALAMGEIGTAVGLAGSALSLGAAMTPLSAIAAPVMLFTGISASIKADENLEKANVMYAEAEEACEKMSVAQILCTAITERSNMYDKLLGDLDSMYGTCTVLLDKVTKKKVKKAHGKTLTSADFTEEELKLIAVTRALTGAVKAVIDTPILSKDGDVSGESKSIYDSTVKALPSFNRQVDEVKSYNYHTTLLPTRRATEVATNSEQRPPKRRNRFIAVTRNIAVFCLVLLLGLYFIGYQASKEAQTSSTQSSGSAQVVPDSPHQPSSDSKSNISSAYEDFSGDLSSTFMITQPIVPDQVISDEISAIVPSYIGLYDISSGTATIDEFDPFLSHITGCLISSPNFDTSQFFLNLDMRYNDEDHSWSCENISTEGYLSFKFSESINIPDGMHESEMTVNIFKLEFDFQSGVFFATVTTSETNPRRYGIPNREPVERTMELGTIAIQLHQEVYYLCDKTYYIYLDANFIPLDYNYAV